MGRRSCCCCCYHPANTKEAKQKTKKKRQNISRPFLFLVQQKRIVWGVYICVYKAWSALARSRDSTVRENIYKRERGGTNTVVYVCREIGRQSLGGWWTWHARNSYFLCRMLYQTKKAKQLPKKRKRSRPATVLSCFLFLFLRRFII